MVLALIAVGHIKWTFLDYLFFLFRVTQWRWLAQWGFRAESADGNRNGSSFSPLRWLKYIKYIRSRYFWFTKGGARLSSLVPTWVQLSFYRMTRNTSCINRREKVFSPVRLSEKPFPGKQGLCSLEATLQRVKEIIWIISIIIRFRKLKWVAGSRSVI